MQGPSSPRSFSRTGWRSSTTSSSSSSPRQGMFTREEQRNLRKLASPGEVFDENGDLVLPAPKRSFAFRPSLRRETSASTTTGFETSYALMYGRSSSSLDTFSIDNPVLRSNSQVPYDSELLTGMYFFHGSAMMGEDDDDDNEHV
ncbi:hypothetical protein BASA81_003709 [Batrachochytrium salamandrivorans]|nr:hypothetical protein BASA81_003709 [Batrachochytrium salamandrivorans]